MTITHPLTTDVAIIGAGPIKAPLIHNYFPMSGT